MWRWRSYSLVNVWLHARVGVCPTDLRVAYSYLLTYMWSCTYTPVTLLLSLDLTPLPSLPLPFLSLRSSHSLPSLSLLFSPSLPSPLSESLLLPSPPSHSPPLPFLLLPSPPSHSLPLPLTPFPSLSLPSPPSHSLLLPLTSFPSISLPSFLPHLEWLYFAIFFVILTGSQDIIDMVTAVFLTQSVQDGSTARQGIVLAKHLPTICQTQDEWLAEHNKHSEKQQCWGGLGDGRESGEPKEPRVTLTQAASI